MATNYLKVNISQEDWGRFLRLEQEMKGAAKELAFERAAELRDLLIELKGQKNVER
ncbi:MAG: UvrB/UvrC motif-containing protein [Clostridia bacterium]|jgi:excinuclease UvrABC helicase subunit UvrB|nr:UvrB/UvrC motif-containing protein [Clostridia bacterium]MDD4665684.1 UvrB/UvrC motif-containing protein [Clostridia bacterium]